MIGNAASSKIRAMRLMMHPFCRPCLLYAGTVLYQDVQSCSHVQYCGDNAAISTVSRRPEE